MFFWRLQSFIGLALGAMWLGVRVGRRVHWLAGIGVTYALCQMAMMFQGPWQSYGGAFQVKVDQASPQAYCLFFAVLCLVTAFRAETILKVLGIFVTINAGFVLANNYGIFNANSFDASVSVMLWPALFLFAEFPEFMLCAVLLNALAVFSAQGSTAWITLSAQAVLLCVWYRRGGWLVLPLVVAFFAWMSIGGDELFNPQDRFLMWKMFMKWWGGHAQFFWFGSGGGTFEWLAPLIQNRPKNIYIWMHNDYLQILFEFGVVGLGLVLSVVTLALWRARKNLLGLLMLLGVGMVAGAQFPLRFFISALAVATILKFCFEKRLSVEDPLERNIQIWKEKVFASNAPGQEPFPLNPSTSSKAT